MFERLCIIGAGLIGGSVALAARANGLCSNIVAYGREADAPNLQTALELGVVDACFTDLEPALAGADLVLIAVPVGAVTGVFRQLRPFWSETAVYTDVCSAKGSVLAAAVEVFGRAPANFIAAHPIAGAERSGAAAAQADLFQQRRLIITPDAGSDPSALQKVQAFWQAMGAWVSLMTPAHHDTVFAATSHLPHLLAFALVGLLGRQDEQREIFKFAAGGFRDFSRIASSDPTMWVDIALANRAEILPLLQEYRAELSLLERMLQERRPDELFQAFSYAKNARQRYLDQLDDYNNDHDSRNTV